jgi:ribosomal protein L15
MHEILCQRKKKKGSHLSIISGIMPLASIYPKKGFQTAGDFRE